MGLADVNKHDKVLGKKKLSTNQDLATFQSVVGLFADVAGPRSVK